jgi:SagB-type dehydrogenase family enzyme
LEQGTAAPISVRTTELDATNFPEWREQMLAFEANPGSIEPRTYPGYPTWPLPRVAPRAWPPLDRSLTQRRSWTTFSSAPIAKPVLSRLLRLAHGVNAGHARGPVPSAGGLQGLELYLVSFEPSWLPSGAYHYDRAGHHLSQIVSSANRGDWVKCIPSLVPVKGGPILFVLVGDHGRVAAKYGDRALRFLLIEAGHLAQNLCLLAASLRLCALPLGGFFEREIAQRLVLPATDEALYLLLCGKGES